MMNATIARLPTVQAKIGIKRTAIYARISDGVFPPPVRLGDRAVGWPVGEIDAVSAAWIAGYSKEQIRELVSSLLTRRKDLVGSVLASDVQEPTHRMREVSHA